MSACFLTPILLSSASGAKRCGGVGDVKESLNAMSTKLQPPFLTK